MHSPDTPIPVTNAPDTPDNLTPAQANAAYLLAAGHSPGTVAQTLNINRSTLYRWRQEEAFALYLHDLHRQLAEETLARTSQLALQSLDLIAEQLNDPNTPVELRLKIAFRLLTLQQRAAASTLRRPTPSREEAPAPTPCTTMHQNAPSQTMHLGVHTQTPGTKYQEPGTRNHEPITKNK